MTETESKMQYEAAHKMPIIIPTDDNFQTLCICAVRYSLGRMTYMPSTVCRYVTPFLEWMDDRTLYVLNRDITEAAEMNRLGMDCDKETWMEFRAEIQREMARRKESL